MYSSLIKEAIAHPPDHIAEAKQIREKYILAILAFVFLRTKKPNNVFNKVTSIKIENLIHIYFIPTPIPLQISILFIIYNLKFVI